MSKTTLQALRSDIDLIDEEIVALLAKRFSVTRQVGKLKARNSLPAVDLERESAQQLRYKQLAVANGVDPGLVTRIFRIIIEEVVRQHREA